MKHGALTALMIVVVTGGLALAQPGPGMTAPAPNAKAQAPMASGMQGMQGMMPGPAMPDMTPEQLEKIDALRAAHMKTVMPIQTDIRVAEIELDALWRADKLDAKKIVAKVNEIGGLRQKLELAMVNHRIEMHNALTPDQQKAMRKMQMGRGRGMIRGKGRGMGRGMKGGMKGAGSQGQMGQCDPQNCKDCMMH